MPTPITYYDCYDANDFYYWNYRRLRLAELSEYVGSSVLDVGAGAGGDLAEFRDRYGREVAAYDPSPASRSLLAERGFVVYDDLARIERTFDTVFLSHVIEHVSPGGIYDFFEALCARLAPGGNLLIVSPVGKWFWDTPDHYRVYDKPAIETLFHRYGLQSEFARYAGSQNVFGRVLRPLRKTIFRTPWLLRGYYRLSDLSRRDLLISGRKQTS